MLTIECRVDLVEEVKRSRIAFLNGKYHRQRNQTFLAAREMTHFARLAAARKRDANTDTQVVARLLGGCRRLRVAVVAILQASFSVGART